MVSLGSTETSVLGQPKGTVRGSLSKGDPAAGHRCFPSGLHFGDLEGGQPFLVHFHN